MDDGFNYVIGVLAAIVLGTLIGSCVMENRMEKEAVKRGYAEWSVQEDGSTKWEWKERAP